MITLKAAAILKHVECVIWTMVASSAPERPKEKILAVTLMIAPLLPKLELCERNRRFGDYTRLANRMTNDILSDFSITYAKKRDRWFAEQLNQ